MGKDVQAYYLKIKFWGGNYPTPSHPLEGPVKDRVGKLKKKLIDLAMLLFKVISRLIFKTEFWKTFQISIQTFK